MIRPPECNEKSLFILRDWEAPRELHASIDHNVTSFGLLENQLNGFKKPKKEDAESTTLASCPPDSICLVSTAQNSSKSTDPLPSGSASFIMVLICSAAILIFSCVRMLVISSVLMEPDWKAGAERRERRVEYET